MISSTIFGTAYHAEHGWENAWTVAVTSVACAGMKFELYEGFKKSCFPVVPGLRSILLHWQWWQTTYWKEKSRKYVVRPSSAERLCCPLNTGWKSSHALQVPVVILVMRRWENSLLQGLGWLRLGEWDGAGFTQLLHLFLPDQHQKKGGETPDKCAWQLRSEKSVRPIHTEDLLRRAWKEYTRWVLSSPEKQYFSNCFEMRTERCLLCNISWVWGNLCYNSKLSLADFVSFLFNQIPDCPHLTCSYFVTLSLLEK